MKNNISNLFVLAPMAFACPRTCTPGIECIFGSVLRDIGPTRVVSHTTRIEVELRDREALAKAIEAMGGTVLGIGNHRLYGSNQATGFGFILPGFRYTLIHQDDGKLAFDSFLGTNTQAVIQKLKEEYTIAKAQSAADAHGWMTEKQSDGTLLIIHPTGASITVSRDGVVDAMGFQGTGCDITQVIEEQLGSEIERVNKPEYLQESVHTTL